MTPDPGAQRARILACAALVLMTFAAYLPVFRAGFVELDDNEYVAENPIVQRGLTADGVAWALTTFHSANWHPLTWISHMADCDIWGNRAAGHHLTNLLLHAASALLLLWFLLRTTGDFWRSWLVAALFAVHPVHVESVAWVSERKDVLSGCFWMLTMIAYAAYAERPRPARYLAVLALFALGLMAKPMLVTLPFVLLLLDVWPLRRTGSWRSLVVEKIPLILLSAASCVVTVLAQRSIGAVASLEYVSMGARAGNALISCAQYLRSAFWPHDLAVYYPLSHVVTWRVIGAVILLAGVSAWALRERKNRPYLPVGWLWFLGTLVPVIGLVQVGGQAMADRYTYIPLIGVFVMIAWLIPDSRGWRAAAVAVVAILAALAHVQAGYWRDSVSLFRHTLAVSGNAPIVNYNLGVALAKQGRNDEAIVEYREALRLFPGYVEAHSNMGDALYAIGDLTGAIEQYREAIALNPELAAPRGGLGVALAVRGHVAEAVPHLQKAVELEPRNVEYQCNLARALMDVGRFGEAASRYREALSLVDAATRPRLAAGINAQIKVCESRIQP